MSTVAIVAAFRERSDPSARQTALFDSAQLLQDLRVLSADDMQGRRVDTAGGAKARAYMVDRFKASGIVPFGSTFEEPFTFTMGRGGHQTAVHGVNVIGRIDGAKTPQRYIVVSAHYDHLGVENGVVYDGADDNASGAAALFSVAAYVAAHRTANSIIFAAFDGEEEGLRGALAFVKRPPVAAGAIGIDLNMDMIGRDPNDTLFVVGIHRQPALRPFVERVAAGAPVKLLIGHDTPGEKEDWTEESDHYAFMQAHIPALYFGVEDFDQHHQPTDKFETMTFVFYVRAVETMIQAVKEFDAHLDAVGAGRAPGP
ncbi:MAG TPA: M28 family peptidase [Vicinamibacterales bacterium]